MDAARDIANALACNAAPIQALLDVTDALPAAERAALIAQCAHESASFSRLRESLNYSPGALLTTWPNRFTKLEAETLGRTPLHPADQVAIGNKAYNGRMGNRPGTDDGYDFRGGGYIQLTGRLNYRACGEAIGVELEAKPSLIERAPVSAAAAAWFWRVNKLGPLLADRGFQVVSNVINTGRTDREAIGSDDRRRKHAVVRAAMGM